MRRFDSGKGNLGERLLTALDNNLLQALAYSETEAAFTVELNNFRSVAALIIAVEHE
jgi:hypothetical protein